MSWGEQTFEEMMIGYIDYVEDAPIGSEPPAPKREPSASTTPPPGRLSRLLRVLGEVPPSGGSALTGRTRFCRRTDRAVTLVGA